MKKVILNEDRCIGCGACMSVAPNNFTFNDEGRAEMINDTLTEAAIEASEMCPVSAITIEGTCECGDNCSEEYNCDDKCTCDESCNCNNDCNCSNECNCDEDCHCTADNKCSENCHCNE